MTKTLKILMALTVLLMALTPVVSVNLAFAESACAQDDAPVNPSPPPSPTDELDLDDDDKISDEEFFFAVHLWATCQPIPGTDQYLTDRDIDKLYALWQSS